MWWLYREKKIEKLNFIKIRNFSSSNDTIKSAKIQATEWEKILSISDEGLVPEYVKNSYK